MVENRIEKRIELKAPVPRVWRALTDHQEFGAWFRVKLDGPFVEGQLSTGFMTYPGFEHVRWEAAVQQLAPQHLFSFTWSHPKAFDKESYSPDYSNAPKTLVEFRLEPTAGGTLLTLVESGFENLPADLRLEAFRRNDGGWIQQMKNIESYVTEKP